MTSTLVLVWVLMFTKPTAPDGVHRPVLAFESQARCESVRDAMNSNVAFPSYRCVSVAIAR